MSDVHAGAGCTIGTTMTVKDKIVPNLVGVDIGCFTGDTKVQLTDGRQLSFEELIDEKDKDHWGYSLDKNGDVQVSKLEYPRKIRTDKRLLRITLDNGETIKCTFDHIFYKRDCSEVEAKCLKVGDSLYPLYIKPAKEVFKGSDDEHLCVFNGRISEYILIHRLSDAYNCRHHLVKHVEGRFARHHVDFNKFNNNPPNIERVGWKEHFRIHARAIKYTNTIGITGFKVAEKKHPGLARRAAIKMAKSTWRGVNADVNRQKAAERAVKRNKTKRMREAASLHQLAHNTTKFSELNSQEWMKNRQQLGRIRKVLEYLSDHNLEISEQNYNSAILNFYNYSTYNTAKLFIEKLGLTFQKVASGETCLNHRIVQIEEIEGADVYCLTCSEFGNFALAAGVFVHNCGMETLVIKAGTEVSETFSGEKLDKIIRENIPSGFSIRKTLHKFVLGFEFELDKVRGTFSKECALVSMGTLGGGNHFIEANRDDEGNLYIVIHSGSRHAGVEIANFYQAEAWKQLNASGKEGLRALIEQLKKEGRQKEIQAVIQKARTQVHILVPESLAYVQGYLFDDYLHDMQIIQKFAQLNRKAMMDEIKKGLEIKESDILMSFTTTHNYIDIPNKILRKGAISAKQGEMVLIPMNMRDGSLICIGKGNPDWNYSAPHGAGRLLSRKKAMQELSLDQFKKEMKGIWSSSVSEETLDESPMAYKPTKSIIENIEPTVSILKVIKPIYNFKAAEVHKF